MLLVWLSLAMFVYYDDSFLLKRKTPRSIGSFIWVFRIAERANFLLTGIIGWRSAGANAKRFVIGRSSMFNVCSILPAYFGWGIVFFTCRLTGFPIGLNFFTPRLTGFPIELNFFTPQLTGFPIGLDFFTSRLTGFPIGLDFLTLQPTRFQLQVVFCILKMTRFQFWMLFCIRATILWTSQLARRTP